MVDEDFEGEDLADEDFVGEDLVDEDLEGDDFVDEDLEGEDNLSLLFEEERDDFLLDFIEEFWFTTKLLFSLISLSEMWWNFPFKVNKIIKKMTITAIIDIIFILTFIPGLKL